MTATGRTGFEAANDQQRQLLARLPSLTGGSLPEGTIRQVLDAVRGDVQGNRTRLAVAQALQQLDMYQQTDQLLDRDVNVIDMRVPGMLSLKLGRSVEWDGEKETIVGDPEANKLLRRPYRAPWRYPEV